nr:hypothetical protein StreXyl84_11040 [Streptomyces sp. Xyl84]
MANTDDSEEPQETRKPQSRHDDPEPQKAHKTRKAHPPRQSHRENGDDRGETRGDDESDDERDDEETEYERDDEDHEREDEIDDDHDDRATARRPRPMQVLREARAQFAELTGLTPESVTSFERTEDGWSLEVEVLELARVPDTMSLMASYLVELDPEGQLDGYRRLSRYERGRADAHRSGGR